MTESAGAHSVDYLANSFKNCAGQKTKGKVGKLEEESQPGKAPRKKRNRFKPVAEFMNFEQITPKCSFLYSRLPVLGSQ